MRDTAAGLTIPVSIEKTAPDRLLIDIGSGQAAKNPVRVLLAYFNRETIAAKYLMVRMLAAR